MAAPETKFTADSAELLQQPQAVASLRGPARYVAPLCVCLVYAGLLSFVVLEDEWAPAALSESQEIPVEIVTEPPQPEKPVDLEPQLLNEPAAFDAPRAATADKVDAKGQDKVQKFAPEPSQPKPPDAAPDPAKPTGPTLQTDRADEKTASDLASNQSADDLDREKADRREERAAEVKPDKPTPKDDPLLTPAPLPDINFDGLADTSPSAGGDAVTTYSTTIYGAVMSHVRVPSAPHPGLSRLEGVILFAIDGRGNLAGRRVARTSGSRELDVAVLKAIARSAPFPRPPHGAPVIMTFVYNID